MKISIALCTYNGAKFLREQLESFRRQTRLPDELVVCDDCSTDETAAILEDFAEKSPFPVRVFVNENNLGSTKNFERAISLCAGDVTFLSDQDDVWMANKIERMVSEFEKSRNVGLVFSNAEIVDERLRSTGKTLLDYYYNRKMQQKVAKYGLAAVTLLETNIVTGATAAFRTSEREFFLPIPARIEGIIHDGWIAFVIASRAETVFIGEPLIKYRQHSLQQIGVLPPEAASENKGFKEFCDGLIQLQKRRLSDIEKALFEIQQKGNHDPQKFAKLLEMVRVETAQSAEHLKRRRDLSPARHKRLKTIVGELASGRYHKFGRGFVSAAKDLIRD